MLISIGGPGAPGKTLVTNLGDSLATSIIGGHSDIVVFDLRGMWEALYHMAALTGLRHITE
jgi:hypothetical protein